MNNSNEIIKIKMVSSDLDYENMKKIRRKVFVEEHGIPEEKEFDGNDHHASHVLAYVAKDGKEFPIGTMRIRYFSDFVKFERMAVLKDFRKTDTSDRIMNKGFDFSARKGFRYVSGLCKKELLPRWEKCGYFEIEGAKHLIQNGMELIPIRRELPKDPLAIRMTDYPALLTAIEDSWDDKEMLSNLKIRNKVPALFLRVRDKINRYR